MPLNHVDPATGEFACAPELDCPSTRFDSCLVHALSDSAGASQLALSGFLSCFEGPFANQDVLANDSARKPCFEAHFPSELWDPTVQCASTPALYGPILEAINATRADMYARLGKAPGLFPHIFIDGEHQWNNSWTALFRTLCSKLQRDNYTGGGQSSSPVSAPCNPINMSVDFLLATHGVAPLTPEGIAASAANFSQAVLDALNFAASRFLFPRGLWNTTGEPGQRPGSPSYVNANPGEKPRLTRLSPVGPASAPANASGPVLAVTVTFESLAAFESPLQEPAVASSTDLFEWALRDRAFPASASDVTHVLVHR